MASEDVCDTGLALGLAIGGGGGASSTTSRHRRSEKQERPGMSMSMSMSTAALEPSLTLSLSDEAPQPPRAPRVSSPHSAVSSFSAAYPPQGGGVKRERVDASASAAAMATAAATEEAEGEKVVTSSRGTSDADEDDGGVRKKLRLTKEQSALLEERFKEHSTLNPKQKQALAKQLNLRPRQVEVWFQNRRARTKLKQTEVDCEFLKKCCETLTDENRRLQKELQELRALKFATAAPGPLPPQFYMQFPTAAALTMCPSCERIGGPAAAAAAADVKKPTAAAAFVVAQPRPHFFNPFTHSAAC